MGHALIVLAMMAVMAACPSPQDQPASPSDTVSIAAPSTSVQSTSQFAFPPGVSARIDLSKAAVSSGEPVTVRLVLHNRRPRDEVLRLGSPAQRFDIVVVDSAGREVWSRLYHQDITLVRFAVPLRTGDSLVFRERWDQRDNDDRMVPPGLYTVRGYVSPRTPDYPGVASTHLRVCGASERC